MGGEAQAAGFPFALAVSLGKLIQNLQRQNKTYTYLMGFILKGEFEEGNCMHTHTCMYTHMCICKDMCTHACTHMHCESVHRCAHVCYCAYVSMHMYIYMCTHM